MKISTVFENMVIDVRYAIRQFARTPVFAVAVILTMAIGVTANSTMISLIDALMFRPPAHVKDPDSLGGISNAMNYTDYLRISEESRTVDAAAWSWVNATYDRGANAAEVSTSCVSHNFFPLVGASVVAGRNFTKAEDVQGAQEPVAIVSNEFWRDRLGGDFSAIGRNIWVAGKSFTVIGIAPKNFKGLGLKKIDIWLLITQSPDICSMYRFRDTITLNDVSIGGTLTRLRPGVSREQVNAELSVLFPPPASDVPRRLHTKV